MHSLVILLSVIALVLLVWSISSKHWSKFSMGPGKIYWGLWKGCADIQADGATLDKCVDVDKIDAPGFPDKDIKAVRVLMILATILIFGSFVMSVAYPHKTAMLVMNIIGLVLLIASLGVWSDKVLSYKYQGNSTKMDDAYYMVIVATVIVAISTVCCFMCKGDYSGMMSKNQGGMSFRFF